MKLGRAVTWREADRVADVARVMFGPLGLFHVWPFEAARFLWGHEPKLGLMAQASEHLRDLSGKGGVREEWLFLDICDLHKDWNFCFTTKSARAP